MTQEVLDLAKKAGFDLYGKKLTWEDADCTAELIRFANLVAAKEREACAKVAEHFEPDEKTSYVTYASTAIRARRNT